MLEIHRLVQAVLRQSMDEATQQLWAERTVRAVNRAFPSTEFSTWAVCERLLPQEHTCVELINRWDFEFPEASRLLNQAGFYLWERGRYTDAKPLYQRALAIRERALGPEDSDVATSLNNLAAFYDDQGQYAKAEPLFERALAIWEKALGAEHPNVAASLNDLAALYASQGQYTKAEPLYRRALAILGKALGPEHPNVATSLNNLAAVYYKQGQYQRLSCFTRVRWRFWKRRSGRSTPKVATCLETTHSCYEYGPSGGSRAVESRARAPDQNAYVIG
jgi:tetratricopeptide (TPR) repeat protein